LYAAPQLGSLFKCQYKLPEKIRKESTYLAPPLALLKYEQIS
jgi:hypothetical protein